MFFVIHVVDDETNARVNLAILHLKLRNLSMARTVYTG